MTTLNLDSTERLRREYLGKEESEKRPLRFPHKSAFSFGGHRLSSLYRVLKLTLKRLKKSYESGSPFFFAQILKKTGAAI